MTVLTMSSIDACSSDPVGAMYTVSGETQTSVRRFVLLSSISPVLFSD